MWIAYRLGVEFGIAGIILRRLGGDAYSVCNSDPGHRKSTIVDLSLTG